jgi:hypothetical protein
MFGHLGGLGLNESRIETAAGDTRATSSTNRDMMLAAGASGTSAGSRVGSFANNATCGRQNNAVAYQSPSNFVVAASLADVPPQRSSSFFVARTVNTP